MSTRIKVLAQAMVAWLAVTPMLLQGATRYERRWFYAMSNLQVKENADELIGLIERAAKAGYNGVVLADYKLNVLDRVPEHYFKNVARVKEAADRAKVEIIPTVFPIGYSSGLLAHDPNLAEGLPVREAPFRVERGEAKLDLSGSASFRNGDLEQARGDTFTGFGFQDDPGTGSFADREVVHGGKLSCRLEGRGPSPNRRLSQPVAVRPHSAYRFSAWVKARDPRVLGDFRLLALGAGEGGRALTFFEGGLEGAEDWKRVEIVFNSLDQEKVNLYVGLWGPRGGTLWVDDIRLEELGLVNLLRREGCPLVVASDDGRTQFIEGQDFEPLADPKLGQVPYAGEYSFAHEAPSIQLKAGGRIREGDRLRVSWYHPVIVQGFQVMCCPSEPKTYELLREQARRVNELLRPRTFFMSHDEIRCLNWDKSCGDRKLTPGQILADNVKRCAAIIEEVAPGAEVVVWSDMFDPYHNAGEKKYYLVNGPLEGSWEGVLPKVTMANWNGGKMRQSLEFFAGRGHRQVLAGYYDADDLSGFSGWDEAARGVQQVDGFMYTTWQHRFGLLEAYGRAMSGRD